MVRTWISPSGDWSMYIATFDAAHIEMADRILADEVAAGRIDPEEHGPPSQTASEALIANGWVRYSQGNVDGRPEDIRKHWTLIRDFVQSDTIQHGMNAPVYFDIRDDRGKVIRFFSVTLGQADKPYPPAKVSREIGEEEATEEFLKYATPIEGYMPSGRPIRFGDRHPKVPVRRYRRRR